MTAQLDAPTAPAPPAAAAATPSPHADAVPWWRSRPALVTAAAAAVLLLAPTGLPLVARCAMAAFAGLVICTSIFSLDEVKVCTAVLAVLALTGGSSAGDLVAAASDSTVVLLLGAFVVAGAARHTGLAERLALRVGSGARTTRQLFVRVVALVLLTAFLIPSTSGRAALLVPVHLAFTDQIPDRRVHRALAVLFPVAVLLTAVASLFGAGAHLVTAQLVAEMVGERIDLLRWTVLGLPFALASVGVAAVVVWRLFVPADARRQPVELRPVTTPWSRAERITAAVLLAMAALWLTEPLHGLDPALVALAGAAAVLLAPGRPVTLRQARECIAVDLLFVLVATAEAGAALVRTGGADWIASTALAPLVGGAGSAVLVVLAVAVVSLLAHLAITSRTARSSVLVPVVVLAGGAAGLSPAGLAFLSTAAAGYCLTTSTSAKPLRMFSRAGEDSFAERDLRRLSGRLIPVHVGLLLAFGLVVWPALGLPVTGSRATASAAEQADGGTAAAGGGAAVEGRGGDAAEDRYPWSDLVIPGLGLGPRLGTSPAAAATADAAGAGAAATPPRAVGVLTPAAGVLAGTPSAPLPEPLPITPPAPAAPATAPAPQDDLDDADDGVADDGDDVEDVDDVDDGDDGGGEVDDG